MDIIIHDEQLRTYRELLAAASPEEQREVLLLLIKCLLAEERAEVAWH